MDHAEMLFAAEVRKLAEAYREAKRSEDMRGYERAEAAERQDAINAWNNEFPLSGFIAQAYREIVDVAKLVEALRAREQPTSKSYWESAPPER
jgi:flagellar biosynthesis/type III secretory pathway ATPase